MSWTFIFSKIVLPLGDLLLNNAYTIDVSPLACSNIDTTDDRVTGSSSTHSTSSDLVYQHLIFITCSAIDLLYLSFNRA